MTTVFVFLNDEKNKAFSSKENPDGFVQYGKYKMCIRDKIPIESGYITKAKVKWRGGVDFVYPYLWKEKKQILNIRSHGIIQGWQKREYREKKINSKNKVKVIRTPP